MSSATIAEPLIEAITSADPSARDRSVLELISGLSTAEVLAASEALEGFRRGSENLYERVRASMLLHAIYRYALQEAPELPPTGIIPFEGVGDLMARRFEQAISSFREAQGRRGPTGPSPAPWPRRMSKSRIRPWPTRSEGPSGAAGGAGGCSAWGRPTSSPCDSTRG